MLAYFHGACHTGSVEGDLQLLQKARAVIGPIAKDKTRVFEVECGLRVELHDKLGRVNPFFSKHSGAVPPMEKDEGTLLLEILEHCLKLSAADGTINLLWWSSHGLATNDKWLAAAQKRIGFKEAVNWLMIPTEQGIEARSCHSTSGEPHTKKCEWAHFKNSLLTRSLFPRLKNSICRLHRISG